MVIISAGAPSNVRQNVVEAKKLGSNSRLAVYFRELMLIDVVCPAGRYRVEQQHTHATKPSTKKENTEPLCLCTLPFNFYVFVCCFV